MFDFVCVRVASTWQSDRGDRDTAKPFPLHQDASVLQDGPDFIDDDLDSHQQPGLPPPRGDVTLHPVVGEVGQGEGASGAHVENCPVESLDDPAAEGPARVWAQPESTGSLHVCLHLQAEVEHMI